MISVTDNPLKKKIEDYADTTMRANPTAGVVKEPEQTITMRSNPAPSEANNISIRPNPTPGMVADVPPPATPQNTTFSSTSGDNVKSYIDAKSKTLGQDPGYTTEAGRLYAERTTNGLKTPDASSVNAQNTEDTAASRRAYLARIQSEEAIGQSGFGAGTAQADRMRSTSNAGVNAANQAGQNSVNAYLRQRTEDNMGHARDLEAGQYNKGRENLADAQGQDYKEYAQSEKATDRGLAAAKVVYDQGRASLGDKRYDQTYADNRGDLEYNRKKTDEETAKRDAQRAIENAVVAKNGTETEKRNLLNGLPEGPAKNAVLAGLADGSLTVATALAKVMNPDGSIKQEYRGSTPGELSVQAKIDELKSYYPGKTDEEIRQMALLERTEERDVTMGPVKDATMERSVTTKISSGTALTADEKAYAVSQGLVNTFTAKDLPRGSNVGALKGQQINLDGTVYTVVGGSRFINEGNLWGDDKHTDYTILDRGGKRVYVLPDGKIVDQEPKDAE